MRLSALVMPLAALLLPAAAPARTATITIALSNFKFTPSQVTLEHGQRYVLHLVNQAKGGHDLVAKAFFAAAKVDAADRAKMDRSGVDLEGGESVDIHLIAPPPGGYEMHCSHFMHSSFGMTGTIVVR